MMNGILRIQTYRPRQSAPVEGVTVVITGSGFTAHRITDAEGNAEDVAICAPACALSLDENNTTTLPYAVCSLTARKPGYRTVRIQGIQIFAGQVTLAQPQMLPDTEEGRDIPNAPIIIPPHALFAGSGGSGPQPALHCTPRVLDQVIIPKNITVHLGKPAASARNVTVSFRDYIANVASSEVYPTWPEQALRANIHAQISLALNRIFTEWYPSRGYNFDITNSTSFDQYYVHKRNVFEVMERITDDIFNTYVRRVGTIDPYYTEYCDGKTVTCKGMKQWGTVDRANAGMNALQILRYYYGNNIEIVRTNNIQAVPQSYPGTPLRRGSTGKYVRIIQRQLTRIAKNYPFFGNPGTDGVFGEATEKAVKAFQKQFSLSQDGVVGRSTWYKISYIYISVTKLAQLTSEGIKPDGSQDSITGSGYPGSPLRRGSTGNSVQQLQFWLQQLSEFNPDLPDLSVDGTFGSGTEAAVRAFQREFGLTADGVVGPATWQKMYEIYGDVTNQLLAPNQRPGVYPGSPLRQGSTGRAVREAQYYLVLASAYYSSIPRINIDGEYGPATTAAVRAFQQLFGLTADGVIGPATWAALYEQSQKLRSQDGLLLAYNLLPWPGKDVQQGDQSTDVAYVQYLLQYIGYFYDTVQDPGGVDGVFGPLTKASLESYQREFNLPVTGVADEFTWNALTSTFISLAAGGSETSAQAGTEEYPGYVMALGSAGGAVMQLQQAMNAIAVLYCVADFVPVDGVFGASTEQAVKLFQEGLGLPVTGIVDKDTWDSIWALLDNPLPEAFSIITQ